VSISARGLEALPTINLHRLSMSMKRCLVTGGAGFIGSHLVEALLARGDHVTVVDDESTGKAVNLQAVWGHARLRYIKDTVTNEPLIAQLVSEVDEIYHLAAAVGVRLIAQSPIRTIETNIYSTELILRHLGRLCEAGKKTKIFLASSSEVYGKNPKARWTEEDDLVLGPTVRPRWSYGASKAIGEFLALAYWREYGLPVIIGRFFNVVGPRQTGDYGMVLPRFIKAALSGEPLVVHDDGKQQRSFAHVSDVTRMVLALMDSSAAVGNVCNIGSDQPVSILELAECVIAVVEEYSRKGLISRAGGNKKAAAAGRASSLRIEFQSYTEAYGADFEDCRRRVPDLSKLWRLTGLKASWSLNDIIRQLVEEALATNQSG